MEDPRGNLALTYLGIADRYKPRWIVWENVPGVLSSAGGRDFGSFLGALAQLGYGFAYRVLDARFFGVAQRRRRVFVVGYLGDWRRAAAVLFESPSGRRDTASRREKRQSVAPTVVSGPPFSRTGNARVEVEALVPIADPAYCLETTCNDYSRADGFNMVAHAFKVRQGCEGGGKGYLGSDELAFTLATHQDQHIAQPVSYDFFNITAPVNRQNRKSGDPCHTLARSNAEHAVVLQPVAFHVDAQPDQMNFSSDTTASLTCSQHAGVQMGMAVRRLTPTECERLQGFPDGYTNIKENCPDGPRYKALGNSMAVPVMRWIGERIDKI